MSRKAGGLFDAVSRLAQTQQQHGMDTMAFGLWDDFAEADRNSWNPVPVLALKTVWPKVLGRSPEFLPELCNFGPDITHTHGLWLYPSVVASRFNRKRNQPYLISPHGMLDPWALENSRWKKRIAYWLFEGKHLRHTRCFRALCASEAESIRSLGLKSDIAIIPNGIDLPSGPPPGAAPWHNHVESGKKILLFLSRIHPKKGLVNLLKAWANFLRSGTGNSRPQEWVLAIAGWDQVGHELELKKLCAGLHIIFADIRDPAANQAKSASVLFVGPQFKEAKAACYYGCDAFVLPSLSEGLPMVVLEAWAYSKPVIMTPECNLPEGFQAGAALKVNATETSLAAGLNELTGMTLSALAEMGTRGHELAAKRFSWTHVADQMRAVYQWILGGGCKPDCLWNS